MIVPKDDDCREYELGIIFVIEILSLFPFYIELLKL
jgi:hypothetical protein